MKTRLSVGFFDWEGGLGEWQSKKKRHFHDEIDFNDIEKWNIRQSRVGELMINLRHIYKAVFDKNSSLAKNLYFNYREQWTDLQYLEDYRSLIVPALICRLFPDLKILKIHTIKAEENAEFQTFSTLVFLELEFGHFREMENISFPNLKVIVFKKCPRIDASSRRFFRSLVNVNVIIVESLTVWDDLIPFIESSTLAPNWRVIMIKHKKSNCVYKIDLYRTGITIISNDLAENGALILARLTAMFPAHSCFISNMDTTNPLEYQLINHVVSFIRSASAEVVVQNRNGLGLIRNLPISHLPNGSNGRSVLKFFLESIKLGSLSYQDVTLIENGMKQTVLKTSVSENQMSSCFEMFRQFPSIKHFRFNLSSNDIDSSEIEGIINTGTKLLKNVETLEVFDVNGDRISLYMGLFKNFHNIKTLQIHSPDRNINVLLNEFLPSMTALEEIRINSLSKRNEIMNAILNKESNVKQVCINDDDGQIEWIFSGQDDVLDDVD